MKRILDKYPIYVQHVMHVASEGSGYSGPQRARARGYLKSWNRTRTLLDVAFYLDALEPVRKLSLAFQQKEIDTGKDNALFKNIIKLIQLH